MAPPSLLSNAAESQADPNSESAASFDECFPFFALPGELQTMVCRRVLVSESKLEISTTHDQGRTFHCDLSSQLLRVSKLFYDIGLPLLYSKNVFRTTKRGELNTVAFLMDIGSQNRALIRHLVVAVPYKKSLAYRHQSNCLTEVLKSIDILEIEYDWSRVHPNKRKTQLADYKPALKAIVTILGTHDGRYANLERVFSLPSVSISPFYPRAKLVSASYTGKEGVSYLLSSTSEALC